MHEIERVKVDSEFDAIGLFTGGWKLVRRASPYNTPKLFQGATYASLAEAKSALEKYNRGLLGRDEGGRFRSTKPL
jgi:hypothetical protein